MFCSHCGRQVDDNTAYCPYCGCNLGQNNNNSNNNSYNSNYNYNNYSNEKPASDKPLKGGIVGFLLTFFLGIIGFILSLVLGDESCKRAALITFFVSLGVSIFLTIIFLALGIGFIDYFTIILV